MIGIHVSYSYDNVRQSNSIHEYKWLYCNSTGCRLFEPFNATLLQAGIKIPSGRTKNSYERIMILNGEQMATVIEMREWIENKVQHNLATRKCGIKQISRVWSTACKRAGLTKRRLHYLRHTFGVMEWLRAGVIYIVSKKLGHSSVTTTEIYTKFELSQLQKDFPKEARRLKNNGQYLMGSHSIGYNYGKT